MITQTTIDQIQQLNIVDVIGKYTSLKKKGTAYWACCPFHEEKTPSFTVSSSKQLYKCFGCGAGGNGIGFVMEHQKLDFPQALERIAQDHSITIEYEHQTPEQKANRKEVQERTETLLKINRAAAKRYFNQLLDINPTNAANREIIEKRKYSLDTVLQWQLGYAPGPTNGQFIPNEWQFLTKPLIEKGLFKDAEELGLVKSKNKTNYDTFRNRLIFPIYDEKSRLVGFGGRALGTFDKKKTPKYINSTNTEVFNKSAVLYGLNFAQHSIRKQDFVYIVEGYTDVISLHQAEVTNTAGTNGTALTKEHVKLLGRYTKNAILAYDNDQNQSGYKKMVAATDLLLEHGFNVQIVAFPKGTDPDEFARIQGQNTASKLLALQVDAILFKADYLLNEANAVQRDDHFNNVARSLALLNKPVRQSDLGRKIAKKHGLDWSTFKQMIATHTEIAKKKKSINGIVKKNKVVSLETEAHIYPFFHEVFNRQGEFSKIEINRYKLIQLLKSMGYYRYEVVEDSTYTFVHIKDNLISTIQRDNIIDRIEKYIQNEYDFEAANCEVTDAELLINKFYGSLGSYFSKDQFARLKPDEPIIINKDTKDAIFFYYQNGFVKITKKGRELIPYEQMNGSIWEEQTLPRKYTHTTEFTIKPDGSLYMGDAGIMADFVWKLANQDNERFRSLCSIIGYLIHDYYQYKLKTPLFTDSTLSDKSDGRTGKTLLLRLIGQVCSYCEINGKDFDANDKKKYQDVKIDTQLVHLNDIKHTGRNKFNFEDIFNDITEGYIVDGKWMTPYRKLTKYAISSNRTVNIQGASQIDRVIEFEVSGFFNINNTPEQHYGHWLMRDWDEKEWNLYDNFMCLCAQLFLSKGILSPGTINLEMRKLKDHTAEEFLEFMAEIKESIEKTGLPWPNYYENGLPFGESTTQTFTVFIFDKKKLFEWFVQSFPDFDNNKYFSQKRFTKWLRLYSEMMLGIPDPHEWRSNGVGLIQFKPENNE